LDTLNLGILAHVDAGKTSLTERLLYAARVIGHVGRVDDGDTQTDTLALERRRGITIKSAVVSFEVDGTVVNLIDTPGHPDFIAEVERVLDVLDGVVLVVSAVDGVQPQTRVLMRTLRRLGLPVLIFINKIDRSGARSEALLGEIAAKLGIEVVPMGSVRDLGTKNAAFVPFPATAAEVVEPLADHDDLLLTTYLADRPMTAERVRCELAEQTQAGTGASGVLRIGDHRGRSGRADVRHRRPAADGRRRRRRRALGIGVQDRARAGRPEGGTDPDVQRQLADP
jgi:ribosomal protection tetracycline resistance protein